jgi:hypothetical protein
MVDPVSGSVLDKGNVTDINLANVIAQSEKNAQAGLHEDCMCRLEDYVITGNIPTRTGQPIRCEEFFDGKMRELYHLVIPIVDNSN